MKRIRVVVAEDSLTVRKYLVESLQADPAIEVVGEAADGREAIRLCERLQPDVLTVDMMMPVMTGLGATEYIMAFCPTPILVVSASTNRGEILRTYDALAAGAVDVMDKPAGDRFDTDWEVRFRRTVKLVSRIKVITRRPVKRPDKPPELPARILRRGADLVAVGASTGGPGALVGLLRALPKEFPLPILTVLHLSSAFAGPFAEWLEGLSPFPVDWARDGEPLPRPGRCVVRIAPPDVHLRVRRGRLRLDATEEVNQCRPSIDVLFHSLADDLGERAVGCLLTGMGQDGARGLLAMRRAGGLTLAQDEATSVVYGMPRRAAELGAAERILPLPAIPSALIRVAEEASA